MKILPSELLVIKTCLLKSFDPLTETKIRKLEKKKKQLKQKLKTKLQNKSKSKNWTDSRKISK